jgi:hypothetical protein
MTSARELELEVIAAGLEDTVNRAIVDGGMLWLTDEKGHRHGIVVERMAFFEIETDRKSRGVGFGPGD